MTAISAPSSAFLSTSHPPTDTEPCTHRRLRHRVGRGQNHTRGEAMSEQDVETIRGGYDAFNSGNPQGVLERMDADGEWVEPGGGNAPSGTFRGPQSVGEEVFPAVGEYF